MPDDLSGGRVRVEGTHERAGAAANTYTYDQAGRLASSSNGGATTNYGYDADGNRTKDGASTATYNARDRITSSGTSSYTYTARGTLVSTTTGSTTTNYTDNAFDQLATVGSTSYSYDGLGRLAAAGSASFSYDGTGSSAVSDGTDSFGRGPDGQLESVGTSSGADLAFTDQHGDVTGLFAATGTSLAGSRAYDPYGDVTARSGAQSDLGYQGGWTDPAAGDVGTASRWYDPATGDFTSHDTVTDNGSSVVANPYAYANDDPLDNSDPSGRSACGSSSSKGKAHGRGRESGARSTGSARTSGRSGGSSGSYNPYSALYNHLNNMTRRYDDNRGPNPFNPRWGSPRRGGSGEDGEEDDPADDVEGDAEGDAGGFWSDVEGVGEDVFEIGEDVFADLSASSNCVTEHPGKPPAPTHQQIADQAPVNGHPPGQTDPNSDIETPENGTKIGDTLTGDSPINVDTVATPNPNEIQDPYQSRNAPSGSGTGAPQTPPSAAFLSDPGFPCTGRNWVLNGETWDQRSLICTTGGSPTDGTLTDGPIAGQSEPTSRDPYAGTRAAAGLLQDAGVPRLYRVQIMQSFEEGTISVRTTGPADYGMRFYDDVNAFARGRYLTSNWPATREEIAVKAAWNQFTFLKQWQIRPGIEVIEGCVGPQGLGYPGGGMQTYVLDPDQDLLEPQT